METRNAHTPCLLPLPDSPLLCRGGGQLHHPTTQYFPGSLQRPLRPGIWGSQSDSHPTKLFLYYIRSLFRNKYPSYLCMPSLQSQTVIYGSTTGFSEVGALSFVNCLTIFSEVGALPSGKDRVTSTEASGHPVVSFAASFPQTTAIRCVLFWVLCHGMIFETSSCLHH